MSAMMPIRTPEELMDAIKQKPRCFFIQLNYGAASVKQIEYNPHRKRFLITNEIDGTKQTLTHRQLMSPKHGNIGPAMVAGAFYAEMT